MSGHLGDESTICPHRGGGNSRNGTVPKTVLTGVGAMDLAVQMGLSG
jgi:hypothetical protein